MARRRAAGADRRRRSKQQSALMMQKASTERSKSIASRNVQMNEMQDKQREANKKGMFEGNWMKVLGTALALAAVIAVTGGFGLPALVGAAGSGAMFTGAGALAVGTGIASGLGTLAGMKAGDVIGGDVEGAYEEAGTIDESKLYRGTVGSGYNTLFDPLTTRGKGIQETGITYGDKKDASFIWGPLSAGVTQGGTSYARSLL